MANAAFVAFVTAARPETAFFSVFSLRFPATPDATPIKKGNF
ncbi:hypothetical protein [Klebsiella quasipneumoniae]|nr:hypothetical protein [Klebsiella quasipneumoniae]